MEGAVCTQQRKPPLRRSDGVGSRCGGHPTPRLLLSFSRAQRGAYGVTELHVLEDVLRSGSGRGFPDGLLHRVARRTRTRLAVRAQAARQVRPGRA